jgi:uncharacterized protein YifN (PemK superfamily)
MPIQFHPKVGEVLRCDYAGLRAAEMSKRRWAVVVSPRQSQNQQVCIVVPLSITPPPQIQNYHCVLERDPYPEGSGQNVWAKCDMLMAVSFERLTGYFTGKTDGKRDYVKLFVTANDLKAIQKCMLHALGLSRLISHL